MDRKIITKFTVVTEQGIEDLSYLTKTLALEKFTGILPENIIASYIADNFSKERLINDVNSFSNQWLIVYIDEEAAGYARITSQGKRPDVLAGKRAIRMADFGILKKHSATAGTQSLFEKCLVAGKAYDAIWLNEYSGHPFLAFFEEQGFNIQDQVAESDGLPVPSVYMIRMAQ
ncbi:N-acetyltransferase [Chitinophaga sp. MM2321]|uniref:N-acetyltransferase n=1 Tax=Chitinophaga sp. MM2321 TaxID=3137178 RepID=UPI0032D5750E